MPQHLLATCALLQLHYTSLSTAARSSAMHHV
jgi:hypothetical protein